MEQVAPLGVDEYRRIVVLTGAGVSVASGLPTYRGPGGLWEKAEIARLVEARNLPGSLPGLWRLYAERRAVALRAEPNAAHRALADLERRLNTPADPRRMTVITQNVDGLHQRAGSENVVELHGSAFRTRCTACDLPPFPDTAAYDGVPPCPRCGAPLRPDVVLFGETLPEAALEAVAEALGGCDLFLSVGTSGLVTPAANFVRAAVYVGARTVAVNVEPMDPPSPYFAEEVIGPAEHVLPALLR
jgi:NAD-dependent deacetylase